MVWCFRFSYVVLPSVLPGLFRRGAAYPPSAGRQADASRRAAEREGAAARDKEPDEEQILARVQRVAMAKQQREAREAAASLAATPTAGTTPIAAADMASLSPRAASALTEEEGVGGGLAGSGGGVVEGRAGGAIGMGGGGSEGGDSEGSGGGGAGRGGGGRSGSMMAMGIQAFLEESQKKS